MAAGTGKCAFDMPEQFTFQKGFVQGCTIELDMIDVRDPDEFASGSLKGSINIPVDKLEKQIQTLKSDKPIIFVSATGARSGESYYMVQDLRKDIKEVYYLDAALTIKKDGSYTIKKNQQ
jgi:rhodanese-related sulfurtransferase